MATRVVVDQRHAVLARVADARQPDGIGGPRVHVHLSGHRREDRRKSRLQLAEDHAFLDEAVVAAMVALGQGTEAKRAVLALEAAGERGDRARRVGRRDHAGDHERIGTVDTVRPRESRVLRLAWRTRRPAEAWVLGTEREVEVEAREIERHQVDECRRLGRGQRIDARLVTVANVAIHGFGHQHAEVGLRNPAQRIPAADEQPGARRLDVESQMGRRDGDVRLRRIEKRRCRRR